MPDTKLLLDTSALCEELFGTEAGWRINQEITGKVKIVPSIVIAELTSFLLRKGINPKNVIRDIFESCEIVDTTSDITVAAGYLHASLKKKEPNISLVDCIIMEHAKKENATIITLDSHFRHLRNAKVLDK